MKPADGKQNYNQQRTLYQTNNNNNNTNNNSGGTDVIHGNGVLKIPNLPPPQQTTLMLNGRPNSNLNNNNNSDKSPIVPNGRLMLQPPKPKDVQTNNDSNEINTPTLFGGGAVENILKEMGATIEPLTSIAATPRKEMESKFPHNNHKYLDFQTMFNKSKSRKI